MNITPCRPRDHVTAAGRLYPSAWKQSETMRSGRGQGFPDWPAWCFLPIAATQAIVATGAGVDAQWLHVSHPERIPDAARLAGLAGWRMTQGIYRFDPAVYEAVRDTLVAGDIPSDVLYRLPEWCVYIETPNMLLGDVQMHGAFAHLEHDVNTGQPELRFLLDIDEAAGPALMPAVLHLGRWTLADALTRSLNLAAGNAVSAGEQLPNDFAKGMSGVLRPVLEPLLSLLLYLCSQAAEVGDGQRRPANPEPKRVKGGLRLFVAERPTTWDVGVRLGAALRQAYAAEQTGQVAGHVGPRPHIRRAHWHGFRSGAMKRDDGSDIPAAQRPFELRWLPPIAVNVSKPDDLPAVIRLVK
ncbi:AcrVA2 family anti-CRISPR protein [Polaromonas naphthalenivorans]|nr:hypothetical protein [Polaromonas naphthalenivorans]